MSKTEIFKLLGHLDVVKSSIIAGWAYDEERPGPIDLIVYDNGKFLSKITANQYRVDLDIAALGNTGRLAFSLEVELPPTEFHEISVFDAETGDHLPGSPKSVSLPLERFL